MVGIAAHLRPCVCGWLRCSVLHPPSFGCCLSWRRLLTCVRLTPACTECDWGFAARGLCLHARVLCTPYSQAKDVQVVRTCTLAGPQHGVHSIAATCYCIAWHVAPVSAHLSVWFRDVSISRIPCLSAAFLLVCICITRI